MQLISVLACGVAGAESGTADIYQRGTTTRATLYADAEAESTLASVQLALDANGGTEVYVNESVDVIVKDSAGAIVREFTVMVAAPGVEYIGQSFTGVDYVDGTAGAGLPVSLQTILDLWKDSAGAIDFKVLYQGAATLIQDALSAADLFYNVKASQYGATGDGATDDTTFIQAAIDAANTAGGGIVFFPQGTYRITAALNVKANVSLLGVGPGKTVLDMSHASNKVLNFTASAKTVTVRGISITQNVSNTGVNVEIPQESFLVFEDCEFGGTNAKGILVNIASGGGADDRSRVEFVRCDFILTEVTQAIVSAMGQHEERLILVSCRFYANAAAFTLSDNVVESHVLTAVACAFIARVPTSGTWTWIQGGTGSIAPQHTITGCRFMTQSGTPVITCMAWDLTVKTERIHESGNSFPANGSDIPYSFTALDKDNLNTFLGSRDNREKAVTNSAGTVNLDTDKHGIVQLLQSTTGTLTLSAKAAPMGSRLTLIIYANAIGGNLTVTYSGTDFEVDSTPVVADNNAQIVHFVRGVKATGDAKWIQIGKHSGDI